MDSKTNGYIESSYRKILCNYSLENIGVNNIGYSYGVISDGVPFDAEIWMCGKDLMVTFYFPEIFDPGDYEDDVPEEEDCIKGDQALSVGMEERGYIYGEDLLNLYIKYLVNAGLIKYKADKMDGFGSFYTDTMENDLVAISMPLISGGNIVAETGLDFMPFKENIAIDKRCGFRVIK